MKSNFFEKTNKFVSSHKKNFLTILVLLIFLFFLIFLFCAKIFPRLSQKKCLENIELEFANKNEKAVFKVDEITLFSSCDAKNKVSSKSNFTIENLYAYTDIAIFIKQVSNSMQLSENTEDDDKIQNTLENTLKEVSIQNISYDKQPEVGQAKLYYKNLNNFAKSALPEGNQVDQSLVFKTTSDNITDFTEPILYNNCANPITLTYLIENIKTDYTILDTTNPITYNGSLLKRCVVPINTIASKLSFDIYITNNKNEKFKSKIFIDIPYKTDSTSIYDGNITIKQKTNFTFYRYE